MITVITGENSFENERALSRLVADFDGTPERIDGETLELRQLPDLLMGMSLFASKRLVIIKNMSANKTLWNDFENWVGKVSDDIHLVLLEPKPDRRTKTYKLLQKSAIVHESKLWTERDVPLAHKWVGQEAAPMGIVLDKNCIHTLVSRVGVDQWQLFQALQKLSVVDAVTPDVIEDLIEPNVAENVFNLFEAALKGDSRRVRRMLATLELTEDVFRLFGLLSSQAFQLAVLASTDKSSSVVAGDLGVHPFALSKLGPFAKKLGKAGAKKIISALAEADTALKTTAADPWLLLERSLLKICQI